MKKFYTKAEIKKAKEMDLLSFFQTYAPQELVKNGRRDYSLVSHDSLHISNGLWCRWSTGDAGRSALDYLIKVEGYEFKSAVETMLKLIERKEPIQVSVEKKVVYKFKLPPRSKTNENAIHYLMLKRGIDKEVIDYCISKYCLYEKEGGKDVVFVGYDFQQRPGYASYRSIDGKDRKCVAGSDKRYSFRIKNYQSDSLHVFESAIDCMSYMSLMKMAGIDYTKEDFLSIEGASSIGKSIKKSTIPIALETFLENVKEIKYIHLHFDNDMAGQQVTEKVIYHLKDKYEVTDERIEDKYKDVNDFLLAMNKLQKEKGEKER